MTDRYAINLYNKIKMNIFENYLSKINRIIKDNKDILKLRDLTNLSNVNFEVLPKNLILNYQLMLHWFYQNQIK